MIALLDTHALLWSLLEPEKLSPVARNAILSENNTLLVSSASAWELGIKHQLGRLEGSESVLEDFSGNVKRLGAVALGMTAEHALAAAALPLHHRDPFDRMLIAQARAEKAVLISSDKKFDQYEVPLLW